LFGVIVGGLNLGVFEERKQAQIFFIGVKQSVSQGLGFSSASLAEHIVCKAQ
jgi:hypothetical protein